MKNIIFDLGGVIIDLAFDDVIKAFRELGVADFRQYFTPLKQQQLFLDLELGTISDTDFYEQSRLLTDTQLSDQQIQDAWNKVLTPFQPERMKLLENLATKYNLYLFSNTNKIHARYFEENARQVLGKNLQEYFIDTFYSHELHLRKPDVVAFEEVLRRADLKAQDTLFIDDNLENIQGAMQAGLKTIHLVAPTTILDLDFN